MPSRKTLIRGCGDSDMIVWDNFVPRCAGVASIWLTGRTREVRFMRNPIRRRVSPDHTSGLADFSIVQRAQPNDEEVALLEDLAKQGRPACGAEATADLRPSIGATAVLAGGAVDDKRSLAKKDAEGSVPGREILAIATPTGSRLDRRFGQAEAYGTAKASATIH